MCPWLKANNLQLYWKHRSVCTHITYKLGNGKETSAGRGLGYMTFSAPTAPCLPARSPTKCSRLSQSTLTHWGPTIQAHEPGQGISHPTPNTFHRQELCESAGNGRRPPCWSHCRGTLLTLLYPRLTMSSLTVAVWKTDVLKPSGL